jgi:hypothetical protein
VGIEYRRLRNKSFSDHSWKENIGTYNNYYKIRLRRGYKWFQLKQYMFSDIGRC